MTQERTERHLEISDLLTRWAEEELESGELFLASEMIWGAVAHYLKSVAQVQRMAERNASRPERHCHRLGL